MNGWRLQVAERVLRRPWRVLDQLNRRAAFRETVANLFDRAKAIPKGLDFRGTQSGLFEYLEEELLRGCAIDYLEFGVWEGITIKRWVALNANPESRFFGFDSFEGLPSDWNPTQGKGTFDVQGQVPQIDDPRVKFVRGWFHKTLPGFLDTFKPQHRLVVHVDCDLYASALCVLTSLDRYLTPGSLVIFDEFYDLRHEFSAWCDYTQAYWREARGVCFTPGYTRVALLME